LSQSWRAGDVTENVYTPGDPNTVTLDELNNASDYWTNERATSAVA